MKRSRLTIGAAALLLAAAPGFLNAWGGDGHRYVNEAAIDDLPAEMFDDGSGNAFDDWRDFLITNSTRPDSIKSDDSSESPRHWCDADLLIDTYPYPFDNMPRDLDNYIAVFGRDNGVNQWDGYRDHYDGLVVAFRMRNWNAAYRVAADLGHYVADLNQPFHTTVNYNGQLTGNYGIHSRHESSLVSRKISYSDLKTRRSNPPLVDGFRDISDPVEAAFDTLEDSYPMVATILAADTVAAALDSSYGTVYYNSLYAAVGEQTVDRLSEGGRMLADLWYSAWKDAGQPSFGEAFVINAERSTPTIDGDLSDLLGQGHLQTNTTDWGDNDSEIDQLFVNVDGDSIVFGIAGNLGEDEAVTFFLDTGAGGTYFLNGQYGTTYLNFSSNPILLHVDLRPDYLLSIRRTSGGIYEVHLFDMNSGTGVTLGFSSQTAFDLTGGGRFAIDNSNTGGVTNRYANQVLDAENVLTGIELRIPAASIGVEAGEQIGLAAALMNGSSPQFSNQTIPGLPMGEFASDVDSLTSIGRALFLIPPAVRGGWMLY
ncbi:hypothetical protein KQI84_06475 [bacterium]|nr:hypothetical protein [bacterium]